MKLEKPGLLTGLFLCQVYLTCGVLLAEMALVIDKAAAIN